MKTLALVATTAIALGTALAVPRAAVAQLAFPTPGARVRVTAPALDIRAITGTLVRATPDSLTVAFPARTPQLTIPIPAVTQLDAFAGKDRGAGLGTGVKFGALFGMFLGVIAYGSEYGCDEYCGMGFAVFGVGGAAAGAILGGIIGVTLAPDRWEHVPLPAYRGMGVDASRSRFRTGLTIAL